MARKRSILYHTVQSILKLFWRKHRRIVAIFFALLTLLSSLMMPVLLEKVTATENTSLLLSQISNSLTPEQQGHLYYNAGDFAKAAESWQKAADAYGNDNKEGKNRNLINKARAIYSLGLYPEACNQIIHISTNTLTCDQLISNNKNIDNVTKKRENQKFIDIINLQEDSDNKVSTLHILGNIFQKLGKLNLSKQVLEIGLKLANKYPKEYSEYQNAIYISLGNLERSVANKKRDSLSYQKILDTIVGIIDNEDINSDLISLYNQAYNYYDSVQSTPILIRTQAELNHFSLLVENKQWWTEQVLKMLEYFPQKSQAQLDNTDTWQKLQDQLDKMLANIQAKIESRLDKLPQSREAVYAKINFSESLTKLNLINLKLKNQKFFPQQQIANILFTAIKQSRNLRDRQAEALALTNLARLYEMQVKPSETLTQKEIRNLATAKKLTEQALSLSNEINADNRQILYTQRHQLGRIFRATGNIKAALSSYAEAWNILQSLRQDLVTSADNQFTFRQNIEPIYREFIDLLLQYRDKNNLVLQTDRDKINIVLQTDRNEINIEKRELQEESEAQKNPLYIARLVMQSLQLAELDNFFQEPCSQPVGKPLEIDKIDKDAVVIYPIILENRLEIITSQAGKPISKSVLVNKDCVNKALEKLANIIYNNTTLEQNSALNINLSKDASGQLNESEQKKLENNQRDLQQLSGQIYDWLIKPLEDEKLIRPLAENNHLGKKAQTLVFVLDRSFQKIPIAALYDCTSKKYLIEKYNVVLNLGQKLVSKEPFPRLNVKILAAGTSKPQAIEEDELQGLEIVEKELDNIEELEKLGVATTILREQQFNKNNLRTKIKASPTILHLTTHGVFSSNRERTFILASDGKINVDEFQELLNPRGSVRNKKIELLVLSACQTASGDERAALGMAGVAIRSEASSIIASLWAISAPPTVELMREFYQNLIEQKQSRAEALRNAQISFLKNQNKNNHPSYWTHPFYWAPFVLVGNWL